MIFISKTLNIFVACEESQAVCTAFRELGHIAWSCDIQECSGDHPEWHIQGDCLSLLNGKCVFKTQDGKLHYQKDKWDLLLAFPPCTHLAVSGACRFEKKREDGRQREAIEFFCRMLYADCDRIVVENPVNIISGNYVKKWFPDLVEKYSLPIKPTQTIEPFWFGHQASKKTCLWEKNIIPLVPTNMVDAGDHQISKTGSGRKYNTGFYDIRDENGKMIAWNDPRTAKLRSKTYPGVAKAMAEQWSEYIVNENKHEKQICLF